MSNNQRNQEWASRIADFKASGLTMSAWCEAHGLTIHQLKYWLRKMNRSSSVPSTSPVWQPIAVTTSAGRPLSEPSLVVRVGEANIEIRAGFQPELLREVVRALALC